jgi:hypothetical protein
MDVPIDAVGLADDFRFDCANCARNAQRIARLLGN